MMFFVYLLCFIAGAVVLAVPGRRIRFQQATYAGKYPNGVIRPAVDDLTGASITKVDVKDWAYVRSLEVESYGKFWHRMDGTTEALGWEPVEDKTVGGDYARAMAAQESKSTQLDQERMVAMAAIAEAEGINVNDIRTMTVRQYAALRTRMLRATEDDKRATVANLAMTVHLPNGSVVGPGRVALPPETYNHLKRLGYVLDETPQPYEVRPLDYPANPQIMPWGSEIDAKLREATLDPEHEGISSWRYTVDRDNNLDSFDVFYTDGGSFRAAKEGGHWRAARYHGDRHDRSF